MIDIATILFSTIMCIFVLVRAVLLDARVPWFDRPVAPAEANDIVVPDAAHGWRQRAAVVRQAGADKPPARPGRPAP